MTCLSRVGAVAAGFMLAASCSSGSGTKPQSVTVTQKEFTLSTSSSNVKSGNVTVTVNNSGSLEHELVVFRSDLDENSLPMEADGHKIDEEGSGITHLEPEAEDVNAGGSKTITIDLPPGRYVFVCNVEDHYKQGMHTVVTSS
jgi:uncharacterized cupredoxin-like copper-binding protein